MEFTASPSDVLKVAEVAQKIDPNPLVLAGRLIGLGAEEQKAGIPVWTYVVFALGIGTWIGVKYGPTIRRKLGG